MCRHIQLGRNTLLPASQADAVMLSALLLLAHVVQEGERGSRRPLHVVAQVRRTESVQVCNYFLGAFLALG